MTDHYEDRVSITRAKTLCKIFQPVECHAVGSNNYKIVFGLSEIKNLWFGLIYL